MLEETSDTPSFTGFGGTDVNLLCTEENHSCLVVGVGVCGCV